MPKLNTFTITEAAKKIGISTKTLRRWEESGQFAAGRTLGGQRRYSLQDIKALKAIKKSPIVQSSSPNHPSEVKALSSAFNVHPSTARRWLNKNASPTPTLSKSPEFLHLKEKVGFLAHRLAAKDALPQAKPTITPASKPTTLPLGNVLLSLLPFLLIALPVFLYIGFGGTLPELKGGSVAEDATIGQLDLAPGASPSGQLTVDPKTGEIFATTPSQTTSGTQPSTTSTNPITRLFTRLPGAVKGITATGGSNLSFDGIIDSGFNFGVAGTVEGSQLIASTASKAPFVINSRQIVNNLNADLLDGHEWAEVEAFISEPISLQKSYEAGQTIDATAGDLTFTLPETSPTDPNFVINLTGDTSSVSVVGSASQAVLTLNDNATYPVDIAQQTRVQAALYAKSLYDTDNSTYLIDPASTGTSINVAGNIVAAGGNTLGGTLDANGQVDLGDGGDTVTLHGSSITFQTFNTCTALETNGSGQLVCGTDDTSTAYWSRNSSPAAIYPTTTTDSLYVGGATAGTSLFTVDGATGAITASSNLTLSGTTGITASGAGAGVIFTGSGNHLINASNGSLVLDTGSSYITLRDNLQADGAATIGGNLAVTGTSDLIGAISNSSGNLVVADTVDLGSATTGLRISTTGNISDIDGDITITDNINQTGNLDMTGTLQLSSTLTANGTVNLGNGDDAITLNGSSITLTGFNTCTALETNGSGVLQCGSDDTAAGTGQWNNTLNVYHPANEYAGVVDLAIGGTSTASAKFQVFGNTGNATSSGNFTFAGPLQTTQNQTLTLGGNTTGNIILSPLNGSGRVGIGISNPTTSLDVNGTTHITTTGTMTIDGNSLGTFTAHDLSFRANNTARMTLLHTNGNLGISDTTPDSKLEVLSTTEQLRLTHTDNTADARFTVNASGNLAIDVTGDTTTLKDNLQADGAATVGGNLAVTGSSTLTGLLDANGQVDLGDGGDTITLNGSSLTLTGFNTCTALETNGSGVLQCGSDDTGAGSAQWANTLNVYHPANEYASVVDLAIGGTSTASAKFQVYGNTGNIVTTGTLAVNGDSIISDGPLSVTPTTTLTLNSTGDMTLDSSTDIILDADGADIILKDAATTFATLTNASTNLTIVPAGGQVNITGDLDVSDQGAFGSAGTITAGQTLTVDNVFTDTSGNIYAGLFRNQAEAAGASTAVHYGVYGQARLDTTNGPTSLYGVEGIANLNAAGTVSTANGLLGVAVLNDTIAGTVSSLIGLQTSVDAEDATLVSSAIGVHSPIPSVDTGAITTAIGVNIQEGTKGSGTIGNQYGIVVGTMDNAATTGNYGIYLNSVSGAGANNYALYTNLGNVSLGDDLLLRNDSDKLLLGAGSDLELYHNGTNSYIVNNTGNLYLTSTSNISLDTTTGKIEVKDNLQVDGAATVGGNLAVTGDSTFTGIGIFNGTLDANGQVDLGDGGDTITLNGSSITLTSLNDCTVKTNGSGVVQCGTDSGGNDYWTLNSGALYPVNTTLDLFIGGTSTASAKFAVKNINSGVPNATVSGTITAMLDNESAAGTCNAQTEGQMFYDKTTDQYKFCDGTTWNPIGSTSLFTNTDAAVANGSYVEVAHNQATNDLIANGWVYDPLVGDWKPVNEATSAADANIDNFDSATSNWTSSDSTNFTLTNDTAVKTEGTGSLKITNAGSSEGLNEWAQRSFSTTHNLVDKNIYLDAHSTTTGNILKWHAWESGQTGTSSFSNTNDTDTTGTLSFRISILGSALSTSGNQFRIAVDAHSANATTYTGWTVCQQSSGANCTAGTWKKITWDTTGGSGQSTGIISAGQTRYSDWIDYDIDETSTYHLTYYTSSNYRRYDSGAPAGVGRYWIAGDYTGTENWSSLGSSFDGNIETISAVEVRTVPEKIIAINNAYTWQAITWDTTGETDANLDSVDRMSLQGNSTSSDLYYIDNLTTQTPVLGPYYQIVQTDTNNVRLYNFSGSTQNLRLVVSATTGTGGGNSYWSYNSTNGTLSPVTTSNDVLVGGSTPGSATIILDASTGYITGQRLQDTADNAYFIDPANSGNSMVVAGDVGIGVLDPTAPLHINRTLSSGDLITTQNNSVNKFTVGWDGHATISGSLTIGTASMHLFDDATSATVQSSSGNLNLQVGGTTAGVSGNSSIFFRDSSGTTRGRFDTSTSTIDTGDGSDGAVTISADLNMNTTDTTADSDDNGTYADGIAYKVNMSVAWGANSLTVSDTPSGLAVGDEVLLINLQGGTDDVADVGNYEYLEISSIATNTLTFTSNIQNSYDGATAANQKVVVQRVPQYTSVTISTSGTDVTASAWDGLTTTPTGAAGYLTGIVAFRATGTLSLASGTTINTNSAGYRGGTSQTTDNTTGKQGEGQSNYSQTTSISSNISGGGGGINAAAGVGYGGGGGGGGYATTGTAGFSDTLSGRASGAGGTAKGDTTLTTLHLGGAGGSGGEYNNTGGDGSGAGGNGGGIVYLSAATITNSGSISANGASGGYATGDYAGGGGGGAGGSVNIQGGTLTLGTDTVSASPGTAGGHGGGFSGGESADGGPGADGRIYIKYSTSITGSTEPAATITSRSYGTLYVGATNTSSADVAEHYPSVDHLIAGEVVVFDKDNKGHVKRSTQAADPALIGIVSTDPGVALGYKDNPSTSSGSSTYPIALVGRVPVSIDPASAPIEIGDYLTSSTTPGKAKKATTAGPVIARALESWTPESGKPTIEVFVQLDQLTPELTLNDLGEFGLVAASPSSELEVSLTHNPLYLLTNAAGEIFDSIGIYADLLVGNLTAGSIETQDLIAHEATFGSLTVTEAVYTESLEARSASISGTLYAEDIVSPSLTLIEDEVSSLSARLETLQANVDLSDIALASSGAEIDALKSVLDGIKNSLATPSATPLAISLDDASLAAKVSQLELQLNTLMAALAGQPATSAAELNLDLDASTSALLATSSGELTSLTTDLILTPTMLSADTAFVSDFLSVTGNTLTTNLAVSNQLNVGNLILASNSISTSCTTPGVENSNTPGVCDSPILYLQPAGGRIDFLAGLMILDSQGLATINGDLMVTGNLFSGSVTVDKYLDVQGSASVSGVITASGLTNRFGQLLDIKLATESALAIYQTINGGEATQTASITASGSATFAKLNLTDSTGTTTLVNGHSSVAVNAANLSENSKVFITFKGDYAPATKYWINLDEGCTPPSARYPIPVSCNAFTIHTDYPVTDNVNIDWWILN